MTPNTTGRDAKLFGGAYRDRRVLLTGHTGFKGSWLTLWLERLGAQVTGYAADARNFGPDIAERIAVQDIIRLFQQTWPSLQAELAGKVDAPAEARTLRIDSSRATRELGWHPLWDWRAAVLHTAARYRGYCDDTPVKTERALDAYISAGVQSHATWAVT